MSDVLANLKGVSVSLGGRDVVRDVDLSLGLGEILLLVGHNGSGKSTLLQGVAGLIPTSGQIETGHHASILLQHEPVFLDQTGLQNISAEVLGRFRPTGAQRLALRTRVAAEFADVSPYLERRCGELSGGERRLVGTCRTSFSSAKIKLFDEPSVGIGAAKLDGLFGAIRSAVQKQGAAAIIAEHNFLAARNFATRLCVMQNGAIAYLGSLDLLNDTTAFNEVYF